MSIGARMRHRADGNVVIGFRDGALGKIHAPALFRFRAA
jgi:hypothetical protein